MSREVDERVVKLEFDNKDFEKNAKKSSSTIQDLKSSMDFSKEKKSVDDTFDGEKLNAFQAGLSKVKDGFNALEVTAITALVNISNRITDLGINLVKSLTVDNIAAGWNQYGQTMISKATLVAQGHDLEVVNKQLDKLRWFTDETSYDYDTMTATIGKFVAKGKGLEDSVDSMMGIATWAASAGENATTASHAMQQLAEVGEYIKLQDWQSIQNSNMDIKEFRELALATAEEMGTLISLHDGSYVTKNGKINVNNTNFAQSLTQGAWFTSDVLIKVLQKYAKGANEIYDISKETGKLASEIIDDGTYEIDQFGLKTFALAQQARTLGDAIESVRKTAKTKWSQISELLFGDLDESTKLWTQLSEELIDLFTGKYDDWIEVLQEWKSLGGFNDLFGHIEGYQGALWNIFDAIRAIKDIIKGAFGDVFGVKENEEKAKSLKSFTERIREFTQSLIITGEKAEKLRKIFRGVFSVLKVAKDFFVQIWNVVKVLWPYVKNILGMFFTMLADVGQVIYETVKDLKSDESTAAPLKQFFEGLKNIFIAIVEILKELMPVISAVVSFIGEIMTRIAEVVKKIVTKDKDAFRVKDLLSIVIIIAAIAFIMWQLSGFVSIFSAVRNVIQGFADVLDSFATRQYAAATRMLAEAILMVAIALTIIASIEEDRLAMAVAVVAIIWAALILTIKAMADLGKNLKKLRNIRRLTTAMQQLALSILLIALSLFIISKAGDKAIVSAGIVVGLMYILIDICKKLSSNVDNIKKGCLGLIALAVAVNLLAIPIGLLGILPVDTLFAGLLSIITLLMALVMVANGAGKNVGNLTKAAVGFIALAAAIDLLVIPILIIGSLDIFKALTAAAIIGGLMAIMFIFSVHAKAMDPVPLIKLAGAIALIGLALIPFSIGLAAFVGVIKLLEGVDVVGSIKDMVIVAGMIAILGVLATIGMPIVAALLLLGVAVSSLAFGLLKLVLAIKAFALISSTFTSLFTMLLIGVALAITNAIPALVKAITMLVVKIVEGFLSALLSLQQVVINAIIKFVTVILTAIKNNAYTIVTNLIDILTIVLTALNDSLPKLLPQLIRLVTFVVDNLLSSLAELAPLIVRRLGEILISLIYSLADLLRTIGIPLRQAILTLMDAILQAILDVFGLHDPSEGDIDFFQTLGKTAGKSFVSGFIEGIGNLLVDFFTSINEWINEKLGWEFGLSYAPHSVEEFEEKHKNRSGGTSTDDVKYYPFRFNPISVENGNQNGFTITQNVNVYGVTDPEEVANVVSRRLAVESERYRVTTGY